MLRMDEGTLDARVSTVCSPDRHELVWCAITPAVEMLRQDAATHVRLDDGTSRIVLKSSRIGAERCAHAPFSNVVSQQAPSGVSATACLRRSRPPKRNSCEKSHG